jgi:hypothetical protein
LSTHGPSGQRSSPNDIRALFGSGSPQTAFRAGGVHTPSRDGGSRVLRRAGPARRPFEELSAGMKGVPCWANARDARRTAKAAISQLIIVCMSALDSARRSAVRIDRGTGALMAAAPLITVKKHNEHWQRFDKSSTRCRARQPVEDEFVPIPLPPGRPSPRLNMPF